MTKNMTDAICKNCDPALDSPDRLIYVKTTKTGWKCAKCGAELKHNRTFFCQEILDVKDK